MSTEDSKRDIEIKTGNYNENIQGNYTQNNYIQVNNIRKPTTFPQNIPASNTDKFVNRKQELVTLYQQLQEKDIAHIEGMGGIGKTELAIIYSLTNLQQDTYPGGICWLSAKEENIDSQIVSFAQTKLNLTPPENLDLSQKVDWCWTNWRKGKTLIVLDDIKNYSKIKPYLPPQASQFKVLITTRLNLGLPNPLDIEVLPETEALELLAQLVNSQKVTAELTIAKQLCQRLGYLPLAIQLVGIYIKKHNISLKEELRRLEDKGLAHPSMDVPQNNPSWTKDISLGVKAAFELSWDNLSESAQKLGCLLSLFALTPIPWQLVENSSTEKDKEQLEAARIELESLHLLQTENNYKLHQLIQEFFRYKQKNLVIKDHQKSNLCNSIVEIAKEIPYTTTLSDITRLTPYIPHLIETANLHLEFVDDEDLFWLFTGLGRFYRGQGAYSQGLPWYKNCLSICKKTLGEEHPNTANSLINLANLYSSQGRYKEAEPLFLQGIEIGKKTLGEEHPDIVNAFNKLANLYSNQKKYEEAEPIYLQAIEIGKKILGEEHPDIANYTNNLANLYGEQERYEEAEPLFLKALEISKKTLGEEHPNIANRLNNLANLYSSQGRYKEAEPLFLQGIEIGKKTLGEEHPTIANVIISLAILYSKQRRYKKAEPLFLQGIEIGKKTLGEEHPDIATRLNKLAILYSKQRRYKKAEPLFLQGIEIGKKTLGEEHPDIANMLITLAILYSKQKRYEEAEKLFLQGIEIGKKTLGEEHPDVTKMLNEIAILYSKQRRYEEAEKLFLQGIEIGKKTLGEEHPKVITIKNNYKILIKSQNLESNKTSKNTITKLLEFFKRKN
ncbi:MAG: tetratricopeptide repeat protein [Xenococcus sp. MO_188.B8]|nr:tetratricopeptide repeat protein [Xenococcus sp. MO_188.B8]